jgi:hypothetical protein
MISKITMAKLDKVLVEMTPEEIMYPDEDTEMERAVKKLLNISGYVEGADYYHNVRMQTGHGRYTWLDFHIPSENIIIDVRNHSRPKSRVAFFKKHGFVYVKVDKNNIGNLHKYLQWNVM